MSTQKAIACIEFEIARLSRSFNPVPDRTFVMGMIELAEIAELIDRATANRFRDALDAKFCERNDFLKRTST
ncbi:hypothetical protein SAMN04490185_3187 [Pseudomonas frederiksbergensis]|uniref:Uncharacterized protein n=1 Tax=Pseudomonas frederiksbergensis TaxID=104087 RepID=A0A1H4ZH49_9PSED|nr:hypothetical protein [Pseudomonas frederiksbergensis]SED28978.1 hypothetical protein SAMN04490185_3187 [Pseudomonas frederiksbergensis]